MICNPVITNEEFYKQTCTFQKRGDAYVFKFGPFKNPTFKLTNCVVKHPVGKFNKITIEHEFTELFDFINNSIKTALGNEASKYVELKNYEIALKPIAKIKELVEKYEKFDAIDAIITFNDCSVYQEKIYASFLIRDVKDSESAKIDYFLDEKI